MTHNTFAQSLGKRIYSRFMEKHFFLKSRERTTVSKGESCFEMLLFVNFFKRHNKSQGQDRCDTVN